MMVPWLIASVAFFGLLVLLKALFARTAKRRRHRRKIQTADQVLSRLGTIAHPGARIAYLRKLNPYVFEEFLLSSFRAVGWKIRRNANYSGDGGVDGQVEIGGQWHLVQAKRYRGHVNPSHYQAFVALCKTRGMPGLFIHTGRTGKRIKEELSEQVGVVSGDTLLDLIDVAIRKGAHGSG